MCSKHRLAYSWTKPSNTKPIYNEVLGVSCNLLNADTHNHSGFHLRHSVSVWVVHPRDCVPGQGLQLCLCPVSRESSMPQITSLGKDHNSKTYFLLEIMVESVWRILSWGTKPLPLEGNTSGQAGSQSSPVPFMGAECWAFGNSGSKVSRVTASGSAHDPWEKMDFWWWLWTKEMLERVERLNSASFGIFYWSSG